VQTSINGGAGSKPNSTNGRGILGIKKGWRCRPEYVGVQKATPLTH